ncbi:MAG: YhfC family glutamic-type intramembrane protease [Clostridia bacterium]|nr:YhfC family glutamic-type intramembrane protease [Clostridia bacterium]
MALLTIVMAKKILFGGFVVVSSLSIAAIVFTLVVSFGVPVAALIFFAVRRKFSAAAAGAGAVVFLLFSLTLEGLLNFLLLRVNPATVAFFQNAWAYAIYGCLAAGVFEETGRLLAFKLVLKKQRSWEAGVSYGIGHGGIEAILLGGFTYLNNLVYALLINSGAFDKLIAPSLTSQETLLLKSALAGTSAGTFAVAGLERVCAFLLQVALSLLVLYAVRNKKYLFWLLAVLIHAAVDFPVALYQKAILGMWTVDAIVVLAAILSVVFIIRSRAIFREPGERKPD